jgi:hypothetical protein
MEAAFTIGRPNGEIIQTISPYEQASRVIGERIYHGKELAKVYRVLSKNIRGLVLNVKVLSLSWTDETTGEVNRDAVDYNIYYKPIYQNESFQQEWILKTKESIFGKVSKSPYIRNTLILFDESLVRSESVIGWEVKIEKLTPDYIDDTFRNNVVSIDSLSEIQGSINTFPYCAVVKTLFDAEYFGSIPQRAYDVEMLRVKIPGNYNPLLRTYSGEGFATTNGGWDGTWATGKHYTNNPAWCYYDLLTNKRYGLGRYIDPELVDKWSLYNIAKYCDTLVADGYGGLEPRFTCNVWMAQKDEAYKVANDMASIFRGLTYYSNGSIQAIADQTKTPRILFTNANVKEGDFNYSSTPKKARHSIAIVRYNDPKNFYKPSVEYVENLDSIRKYGINEVELTAIGTASRGQAMRLGRWALLSDNLETENITFTAGLEAATLRPGDVFKVFDSNKKIKRYGGRTVEFNDINTTGTNVVLDYTTDFESNIEYKISFLTPSYSYNEHLITGLTSNEFTGNYRNFIQSFTFSGWQASNSGSNTVLNFTGGMDYDNYLVTGYSPWIIELSDKYENWTGKRYLTNQDYDYFRAINIKEESSNEYEVRGLQYNSQKFIEVESGILFGRDIFSAEEDRVPATPYNFNANSYFIGADNVKIDYGFNINSTKNITEYQVYADSGSFPDNNVPDNNYLIQRLGPQQTNNTFYPAETGIWNFRVYAYNAINDLYSAGFATGTSPVYSFDKVTNIAIANLRIENASGAFTGSAFNENVTFVEDNDASPLFTWQLGSYAGIPINEEEFKFRVTVRPYTSINSRTPTNRILYEEWNITGRSWKFTLDKNLASTDGPYREYQIVVEAHDKDGKTSASNLVDMEEPSGRWHAYPYGYDILNVKNPRFGSENFQLKTFVDTLYTGLETGDYGSNIKTGISGYYDNIAYIGPNGDISIEFTSGEFDADLVAGYIFASTGKFPVVDAVLNTIPEQLQVTRGIFRFDPENPVIYHPTVGRNLLGATKGYVSVGLFDQFDLEILKKRRPIISGMSLTNNSLIYNHAVVGNLILSSQSTGSNTMTMQAVTFEGHEFPKKGGDYGPESDDLLLDFNTVTILSSGTVDDITTVVYMYPASGAEVVW